MPLLWRRRLQLMLQHPPLRSRPALLAGAAGAAVAAGAAEAAGGAAPDMSLLCWRSTPQALQAVTPKQQQQRMAAQTAPTL